MNGTMGNWMGSTSVWTIAGTLLVVILVIVIVRLLRKGTDGP
jgi:hypothetical protein